MPYRPRKARNIHLADGVRAILRDATTPLTADQIAGALGRRELPDSGRASRCHGCDRCDGTGWHDGPVMRHWTGWEVGPTLQALARHGEVLRPPRPGAVQTYTIAPDATTIDLDHLEAMLTTTDEEA